LVFQPVHLLEQVDDLAAVGLVVRLGHELLIQAAGETLSASTRTAGDR
jgi:hypothetical protein